MYWRNTRRVVGVAFDNSCNGLGLVAIHGILGKPESITVPISVSSLMEEPVHVHVRSGDGSEAKFWLIPQVRLASNDGFDARTLRELATEVQDKQTMIEERWHEYFG